MDIIERSKKIRTSTRQFAPYLIMQFLIRALTFVQTQSNNPLTFTSSEGDSYELNFAFPEDFGGDFSSLQSQILQNCLLKAGASSEPLSTITELCPPSFNAGNNRASLNQLSELIIPKNSACISNTTNLWCANFDNNHRGIGSRSIAIDIGIALGATLLGFCVCVAAIACCRHRAKVKKPLSEMEVELGRSLIH